MPLNDLDIRRIAAESIVDLRAARRAYAGVRVKPSVRLRLTLAAQKLDLPPPPPEAVA